MYLECELSELPGLAADPVVVGIGEASARLRNIGASKREDISWRRSSSSTTLRFDKYVRTLVVKNILTVFFILLV